MKTIAALILLLAFNTCAEPVDCKLVGQVAASIMTNRQANTDLSEMMVIATKYGQFAELLVIAAYETPRYSSLEYQAVSIAEFSNEITLKCYKELRND